jgi:uncharacterized membrane protein
MGSFPNVHPLLVHFPIVLVLTAALFDLLAMLRHRESLRVGAGVLWLLALAGAAAAVASGTWAEHTVLIPDALAKDAFEDHETAAWITATLVALIALWRIVLRFEYPRGWLKAMYLTLVVGAVVLVAYTGYLGGELVYGHAIGQPHAAAPAAPGPQR